MLDADHMRVFQMVCTTRLEGLIWNLGTYGSPRASEGDGAEPPQVHGIHECAKRGGCKLHQSNKAEDLC